jgi:hypothetical protein
MARVREHREVGDPVGPATVPAHRSQIPAGGSTRERQACDLAQPALVELVGGDDPEQPLEIVGGRLFDTRDLAHAEPDRRVEQRGGPEDAACRRQAGSHDVRTGRLLGR